MLPASRPCRSLGKSFVHTAGDRPGTSAGPATGPGEFVLKSRTLFAAVAAASVVLPCVHAKAAIYGGPAGGPSSVSGPLADSYTGLFGPATGRSVGDGVGLASISKSAGGIDLGTRFVRFDASGNAPVEFGGLGTDASGRTAIGAAAVTASGMAVGYATKYDASGTSLGSRAVRWDSGSTVAVELGGLATANPADSFTTAVNASGVAVGRIGNRNVRWDRNGTATGLGYIATSGGGQPFAINAAGTAVGYMSMLGNTGGDRAVRWDANGTATALGTLGTTSGGASISYAFAINDAGTAVGYSDKYVGGTGVGRRAVRWNAAGTVATELGNLGLQNGTSTVSEAYAVNAGGTAVGYARDYTVPYAPTVRAVRWDATGTAATKLGDLGTASDGRTSSNAYAINAAGVAVGQAYKYTNSVGVGQRAVAWGTDAAAFDLNRVLSTAEAANWTLTVACNISDTNWITGNGTYDPDGAAGPLASYARAFLIKLPYAGDADGDDAVDFNDFLVLQNNFGRPNGPTGLSPSDFNYDGATDFNDFLVLQNQFGKSLNGGTVTVSREQFAAMTAFAGSVPEPTAFAVLALPLCLSRGRRRGVR